MNMYRLEVLVGLLALTPDGDWAAGALRDGFRVSVTSSERNEAIEPHLTVPE